MNNDKIELLKSLPMEVQEKIKTTLKAYDECIVKFEYGKYNVNVNYCLQSNYARDRKFIGEFTKNDIYSNRQQIINYIEEFKSFPIEYKGIKDYNLKNKYENEEISLDELVNKLNI
ncbi:MAG: hypothetical protein RR406_04810 [Bacilli bacterium]